MLLDYGFNVCKLNAGSGILLKFQVYKAFSLEQIELVLEIEFHDSAPVFASTQEFCVTNGSQLEQ